MHSRLTERLCLYGRESQFLLEVVLFDQTEFWVHNCWLPRLSTFLHMVLSKVHPTDTLSGELTMWIYTTKCIVSRLCGLMRLIITASRAIKNVVGMTLSCGSTGNGSIPMHYNFAFCFTGNFAFCFTGTFAFCLTGHKIWRDDGSSWSWSS